MPDELPEGTDESDIFTMKGFDKCEECKKCLESYQIIELI
jgi:hypothetical protein